VEAYHLRPLCPVSLRRVPHEEVGSVLLAGRVVVDADGRLCPQIGIDAGRVDGTAGSCVAIQVEREEPFGVYFRRVGDRLVEGDP